MEAKTMVLLAGAVALTACDLEEAPAESTARSALGGCPIIMCGDNAPTAGDGLIFDEIDLFGGPNHEGVRILGARLTRTGHAADVAIVGDVLYAYDRIEGIVYSHEHLVDNLEINMKREAPFPEESEQFDLLVTGYAGQTVRFRAGADEVVPIYEFKARRRRSGDALFHVCNHNTPLLTDPTWSGNSHHAIVYRGEKYDPLTKTVMDNDPKNGWAFIACNGGAGTKMHLQRHTYAGGFNDWGQPQYMTSIAERTTLLKAITASYCDTSTHPFTTFGQRLAFATAREPSTLSLPHLAVTSIEAVWSPSGAVCLDVPRRSEYSKYDVEKACGRMFPSCGLTPSSIPGTTSWTASGYVLTGNPPPPP